MPETQEVLSSRWLTGFSGRRFTLSVNCLTKGDLTTNNANDCRNRGEESRAGQGLAWLSSASLHEFRHVDKEPRVMTQEAKPTVVFDADVAPAAKVRKPWYRVLY